MYAGILRFIAAYATAWAWFPLLWVQTPFLASSSLREEMAFHPPRNLNAPIFWKFSHLKNIFLPVYSLIVLLVSIGVRCP